MHVRPDVALVGEKWRPGVQPDAYGDRTGGEVLREGGGGGERSCRGREGEEERIALGVDLDPAVADACLANQATMLGESVCVALGAERVQEPGRPLHVGEEERDRARGEVATHRARFL